MMEFSCSRMESLVTGDRCGTQTHITGSVLKQASFMGRIKRTGERSRHLGWLELKLLDSEKLAVCLSNDDDQSSESSLLFPLLDGSEFGAVKRHGNVITLQAARVSLILEAELLDDGDEDGSTILAGKWSRILNRMVSGESPDSSKSGAYFDGLRISVQAAPPAPQHRIKHPNERPRMRTKQLVPQPVEVSHLAMNPGIAEAPHSLIPSTRVDTALEPVSMYASTRHLECMPLSISSAPSISHTNGNLPQSRSLKRISLCLADDADLGFGDDLKCVLETLDKEDDEAAIPENSGDTEHSLKSSPAGASQEILSSEVAMHAISASSEHDDTALVAPNKAVGLERDDSDSSIPSALLPSKQFAAPCAPFNLNDSGRDSVASTPSPSSLFLNTESVSSPPIDFGIGNSPRRVDSILAKEKKQYEEKYGDRAVAVASYNKPLAKPPTVREPPKIPAPVLETTKHAEDSCATAKDKHKERAVRTHKAGNPRQSAVSSENRAISATRKTVSISSEVQVIKEPDFERKIATSPKTEADLPRPCSLSSKNTAGYIDSPRKTISKISSPSMNSPVAEQKTRFVKAVKRILGKKKSKKSSSCEVNGFAGQSSKERSMHEAEQDDADANLSKIKEDCGRRLSLLSQETSDDHGASSPGQYSSSPEVMELSHHIYANLAEPESPEVLVTSQSAEFHETSPSELRKSVVKPNAVLVDATDNKRETAAAPKLHSSKSITALSFRSLSSRTLASKASNEGGCGLNEEDEEADCSKMDATSHRADPHPRTTRDLKAELNFGEHSVEPSCNPLTARMYESRNKSTSILPVSTVPLVSAPPPPHHHNPSTSSSHSSLGSKRSLHSYTSSLSSASSFSTPNLPNSLSKADLVGGKADVCLFSAQMWISVWRSSRWKPLSQLELHTEIIATDAEIARIVVAGENVSIDFAPKVEIRKVGNHDIEVKGLEDTYMFRGREAENAARFFRTLWTVQANGVQPVAAAALTSSLSNMSLRTCDDDDQITLCRRRTLLPPSLSRSNQNLRFVGRPTEPILEE